MRVEATSSKSTQKNTKPIVIGAVVAIAVVALLAGVIIATSPKQEGEQVVDTKTVQQLTKANYSKKKIEYSDADFEKDKAIIDAAYEAVNKESENTDSDTSAVSDSGDNSSSSTDTSYTPPQINIDDMSDAYKEMEKKNDEVIEKAKEEAANEYDDESKDDIKKELEQLDTQTLINNFLTQNNSSLTYVNNNFDVKTGIYTKDSYDNYVAKLATYLKTGETFSNQYTDQVPLEVGAAYMKYFTAYSNTVSMPCSYTNIASLYGGSESDFTCNEYTNWFKLQPNVTRVYSISVDSSNTATVTTDIGKFKLTFSILTTSEAVDNAQFHITDVEKTD